MKRRSTTLDRALARAVVRALDRARDVVPVPARDLARELAVAHDLARKLELTRDLTRELELARASGLDDARELDHELALVRALEVALIRALEPVGNSVADYEVDSARASIFDRELALELELDLELDLAFVRAPAFVRSLVLVHILNRIRALIHAQARVRDFVVADKREDSRLTLARAMGALIALAVQVLPVSQQLRHLEEFCFELLELPWWQRPGYALRVMRQLCALRRALTEAMRTSSSASARRSKR